MLGGSEMFMLMWLVASLLFAVGLRLLVIARRTRELPELLVGAFFVLLGPAGALRLTVERVLPDHVARASAIAAVPMAAAFALSCVFTYRSFRHGVRWARALAALGVASIAATLLVEVHGVAFVADLEPRLGIVLPRALCLGWGAFEALRCHRMMQRRMLFGLGDPVLANRFLLYALWTGSLALIPTLRSVQVLLELAHVEFEWRAPLLLLSLVVGDDVMLAPCCSTSGRRRPTCAG